MMSRGRHILLAALLGGLLAPCALLAQATDPAAPAVPRQFPFVTVDQSRLYAESAFGKVLFAEFEAARTALATENREIEAELEKRERELTEQRATLPQAEFRALADAFNVEVEEHRLAQTNKERAIYQDHEASQARFRQVSSQVLAQVLEERGAYAIIAEEAIILGFTDIDITEVSIKRLDELVGDGSLLETITPENAPDGPVTAPQGGAPNGPDALPQVAPQSPATPNQAPVVTP